jgi:hypothetical protein
MKIDFEMLEKMVDAGASGAVVLAFLKEQYVKGEKRREADKLRKSAENSGNVRKAGGNVRKAVENNWDAILETYKTVGRWSRHAGPDPESPACRCPRELLEKHGIKPAEVQ